MEAMSHTYHLICIDCKKVLDLGKIANLDETGCSIPWMFTGFRDQCDGHRIKNDQLWKLVERFLILHRGHELRVVSEAFLDREDKEGLLHYIDSAEELLQLEIEPEPDDIRDADAVPPDVAVKIAKYLSGL
ncbi:MAG: hypothetical protein F6K41_21335 [Symploca sp. SIO3E6]|nr:hypothetical protein [Caldora sp. SIO3E6]